MKKMIGTILFFVFQSVVYAAPSEGLNAPKSSAVTSVKKYTFQFKTIKEPIVMSATTRETAYKMAASACFNQLTQGKYPGEEKGLDIIDICANPKM